jgi:D-glycero-D-manno-heptose 1,7-bisphosphate phosphatase
MNKAAFLDRDGVLNRKAPEGQYVTRWEDFQLLPGASEAVRLFNHAAFMVIVVSNQRCVAKRLVTSEEVEGLHARMRIAFQMTGARIDDVYYCSHAAEPPCSCRKPEPGMLLEAARMHDINLLDSWIIGDSRADVEAGRAVGCKTARLVEPGVATDGNEDVVASSLFDATHKILNLEAMRQIICRPAGDDPVILAPRKEESVATSRRTSVEIRGVHLTFLKRKLERASPGRLRNSTR